jgi:cellulose synthase/poly-beta-1,6-N-acetylglucosamine synthase-like glycosyltransferase
LLFSACVETLFYVLASIQILAGVYMIVQAIQWLNYVRQRIQSDPGFYIPRTAVLCPCKGNEPGLENNLAALCEFSRQNYEVFFILASASDPAHPVLQRVVAQSRVPAQVIIAGPPTGCAEKVNNLRVAVQQLAPDFEVLVFADSDGRPGKRWLHHLVAPLADAQIGATTTMRWLMPNRGNFATVLLAAWNAPLVTMLGEKSANFCWGGGTAIRRSVFDQAGVLEEWEGSASDDYSMTRALERAGRPILFVPECLTLSFVATDFAGLLEFTNRQVLITRVYAHKVWAAAFGSHAWYCITVLLGAWLTLQAVFATHPAFQLGVLTIFPMLLAAIRGALRLVGVTDALPAWRSQITSQAWIYIVIGTLIPFLYLANFFVSAVSRQTRWRGITYELQAPNQTRIVSR